jgi:hypothetical protein
MEGIVAVVGLVTIGCKTAVELETMFTISARALEIPFKDPKAAIYFLRGCVQISCASGLLIETFNAGIASYTLAPKQKTDDAVQNTTAPKEVN